MQVEGEVWVDVELVMKKSKRFLRGEDGEDGLIVGREDRVSS